MESQARSGEPVPSAGAVARFVVGHMASRSGDILADLKAAVGGGEPTSGHVVSALMEDASRFERALVEGRFHEAMNAAVCVLFLARDLAIREGKIRISKAEQAPAAKA
jgi:hypothetical protein